MLARVAGLGRNAVWEYRRSREDAMALYTKAYEANQVFATPLQGTPFANNEFDWVPNVAPNLVFRRREEGFLPDPDHIRRERGQYKY